MKQWMKGSFLYYIAGALLVLSYFLLWFLDAPAGVQPLRYIGGTILVVGIVLIFLPRFAFRSKGKPEKGKDWTDTTVVVDIGIYAIVRHPLYLGWLLIYVALILLSQHWLIAIIGIPGIACVYLISRQEDQRLIEKFGDDYKDYMQKVPRMNLLAGIIRQVRRRDRSWI
jgi:protein-S-isoprenylcysteine O-methyltransferase Ste14